MSLLTTFMVTTLSLNAAAAPAPKAEVALLADADAFTAGQPLLVGLHFELKPTWHVYWKNPGDAGLPPTVTWDMPEGFTAGPLLFPVPERFESAGLMGYGYAESVTYLTRITPPDELPEGPVTIQASVKYLVCDPHVCLPELAEVAIALRTQMPSESNLLADAQAQLPTGAGEAGFSIDGKEKSGIAELSWIDRQRGIADSTTFELLPAPEPGLLVKSIEVGELKRNLMNGGHTLPINVVATKTGQLKQDALDVLLIWTDEDGVEQNYEISLPYRLIIR